MKKHLHPHHLHGIRVILLAFLLLSVAAIRLNVPTTPSLAHNSAVLAYATSMSQGSLLDAANAARSANNLPPLILSSQLSASAQAKAQDMIDKNYWSHNAPDGTQPWYFFELAGYKYTKAGENLAYGFDTADAVNAGWMNSAGHKANVLGDYKDVGFGFVNGASYQSGQYTVVVAHYGTRTSSPLATPSAPSTPTPTQAPSTPSPSASTAPSSPIIPPKSQPAEQYPTAIEDVKPPEQLIEEPIPSSPSPITTSASRAVSATESLTQGTAPTILFVSLGTILTTTAGFALTHRSLMNHALSVSGNYVVTHPLFDAAAVTASIAMVLNATIGHIQ